MDYNKIYIDGQWVDPISKDIIEVENPATEEIIGRVPAAKEEDTNKAVAAAKEAFKTWQFTSLEERTQLMEKLLKELRSKKDELADVVSKELGAPKVFAKNTHVKPYLDDMENFLKIIKDYKFEEKFDEYTVVKEPVGVVAALTPWNYPFGQIMKKLSPALLTGNTMVLKPSQKTPLVSYILTEAIDKVGFPKGVFNLVPGRGSEVGNVLANHPDVDMVTFTGSTSGGSEVAKLAAPDIKRITLELGGKSPAIILKGADKELAVNKVLNSIFSNTGQSCSAYSRLLVPREEQEEIEKMIIEKSKDFKVGDPNDPESVLGPLASKKQFEKVSYYINKGIDEGAKLILGEIPKKDKGYYVQPTVFTDVDNKMEIAQEEIFGPVLSIISYDSLEEAIEIANDTKYGLASGVYGPDKEALDVANHIRAGNTAINHGSSLHKAPFGGFKHSGKGREGGKYALEEFVEIKTIYF